jgi:hypothetical protein
MRSIVLPALMTAAVVANIVIVGYVFSGDSGTPDHLLFYDANTRVRDEVVLDDQFTDDKQYEVRNLRSLGVPANKNPGSGYEPDHRDFHYTVYRIQRARGEPRHESVNKIVQDQFGTIRVQVREPDVMLVPAFKALAAPAPDAPSLTELNDNVIDHYTCYYVTTRGPFPRQVVTVTDQFIDPLRLGVTEEAEVMRPRLLCAPTKKTHDGTEFPINNPEGEEGPHLMCYQISLLDDEDDEDEIDVWVGDQFIQEEIDVRTERPRTLCVPAEKSDPEGSEQPGPPFTPSEQLGPPSIPIEEGNNVITAGVGLYGDRDSLPPGEPGVLQPGDIVFDVPQQATIQQVLLYWAGREGDPDRDDAPQSPPDQSTIQVNNADVTGQKIAEVLLEGPNDIIVAYRTDITDMGLVSQGDNTLNISGDPFVNFLHDGAGLVVITDDDDNQPHVELRDGVDAAFINASTPQQQVTVPQTFTFPAADFDRAANLTVFVSQVAERVPEGLDTFRTSNVVVDVGGSVLEFPNVLQSHDGLNWDTLTLPVTIPAGVDSLTVHIDSGSVAPIPPDFSSSGPAAFQWIAAILAVTEGRG